MASMIFALPPADNTNCSTVEYSARFLPDSGTENRYLDVHLSKPSPDYNANKTNHLGTECLRHAAFDDGPSFHVASHHARACAARAAAPFAVVRAPRRHPLITARGRWIGSWQTATAPRRETLYYQPTASVQYAEQQRLYAAISVLQPRESRTSVLQ